MRRTLAGWVGLMVLVGALDASAQTPRLVRQSGVVRDAQGHPRAGAATLTFSLYAEAEGGAPLWTEVQAVTLDSQGRYAVALGAGEPEGLPPALFASGTARWLGVAVDGEAELPRVALLSVPYAEKAADADTLGGLPASAYLLADAGAPAGAGATGAGAAERAGAVSVPLVGALSAGTPNFVGKFVSATDLGNSAIYDNGVMVGVNTTTPKDFFHVQFTETGGTFTGLAVQNLSSSATAYSGMLFYDQTGALGQFQGFNNTTHEYRINNIASNGSINFLIGSSSKFMVANNGNVGLGTTTPGQKLSVAGTIESTTGGFKFPDGSVQTMAATSDAVNFNSAFGTGSLRDNTTGSSNAAFGYASLQLNTTGSSNTAVGSQSLALNTTGNDNAAFGSSSLQANTTGSYNTAVGYGSLFANTTGSSNSAVGAGSLAGNTTGYQNAAVGMGSLQANTTGFYNAAVGAWSLTANTTGVSNAAFGYDSLTANTTGGYNAAVGYDSLYANTTGLNNAAFGTDSLFANTTGGNNIAIGYRAGYNLTTGNDNIDIGNTGVAGEGSTIRIGTTGTQTRTFIAGINGVTTGAAGVAVLVDSNGQLGTISSSRRVKDDIADMGTASSALMTLRPVTFHYKSDQHPSGRTLQYGLIAEEVAEVYPGLVARSADGQIETVLYQFLPPMLLNEYQKQQRTIEAQAVRFEAKVRALQAENEALRSQLAALADRLARLESRERH